jgi:hypothetical protein
MSLLSEDPEALVRSWTCTLDADCKAFESSRLQAESVPWWRPALCAPAPITVELG